MQPEGHGAARLPTYDCPAAQAELQAPPEHGRSLFWRVQPRRSPAAAVPREEGRELIYSIRRDCHTLHVKVSKMEWVPSRAQHGGALAVKGALSSLIAA